MNEKKITAVNADEKIKQLYETAFPKDEQLSVFLCQCRSYAAKILIINQISNVQNGFNTKAYYFTFLLQLVSTLLLKVGFTTLYLQRIEEEYAG
jgi:hypothetical protein